MRIRHECSFIFIICHNSPQNKQFYALITTEFEFRSEFRDVANNEWHRTDDFLEDTLRIFFAKAVVVDNIIQYL
jgi:hypothetical protein